MTLICLFINDYIQFFDASSIPGSSDILFSGKNLDNQESFPYYEFVNEYFVLFLCMEIGIQNHSSFPETVRYRTL